MTTVNAGPKAIMQYFFGPSISSPSATSVASASPDVNDTEKLLRLRQKLSEFVRKCDFAVRLNRQLIGEDQKGYQKAMEEHFNLLKQEAVNLSLLEV